MEVTALKGSSGDLQHLADRIFAERGVRYGRVAMIPTSAKTKRRPKAYLTIETPVVACPLMGWSGRAPAPPASEVGKGRQRQGARHVSDTQYRDRRDRHRYRQELVPRRGPRCARRHRAAAKVVAWPSGSAARQYIALPDRHGSLRRRTSPEPQTRIAWSRCQVDAGQICPPL